MGRGGMNDEHRILNYEYRSGGASLQSCFLSSLASFAERIEGSRCHGPADND